MFMCSSYLDFIWICKLIFFLKFGDFGAIISSKVFFLPLSLSLLLELPLNTYWYVWWYSTGLWGSVHFFFILFFFFLFFRLDHFNWSIFKFMDSSRSEMLLNPFSEFFILVIVHFNSRISICFLKIVLILYSCILFDETLSSYLSILL